MKNFESLRVLIIDDMPAMRSLLQGMLQDMGFKNIDEAEDGEDAWHLLQQSTDSDFASDTYDLIVSDWHLSGMSGADLLRAVRSTENLRTLPFIMITAQSDSESISEAISAGVSAYLVKPFVSAHLEEKIRDVYKNEAAIDS